MLVAPLQRIFPALPGLGVASYSHPVLTPPCVAAVPCRAYDALHGELYASLTRTVVASPLPEANWYSAAEAAIGAIYTLHPAPEQLCVAILRHTASAAFQGADNTAGGDTDMLGGADADQLCAAGADAPSVSALSRFFFVMGHVALQQLVHVERCVKHVRRSRHEAEKQSAEDQAERARGGAASDAEDEDINAELGVGSVAADAELDAMKDAAEAQILSPGSLLAPYARLVSAICHHRSLLGSAPALRGSALLALCKLMAVDPAYCDANLQLLFTLLQSRAVEPGLRSNLVIALGDLALRFPNQLEPWTEHIYRPLADPDVAVRKNTMMVSSRSSRGREGGFKLPVICIPCVVWGSTAPLVLPVPIWCSHSSHIWTVFTTCSHC